MKKPPVSKYPLDEKTGTLFFAGDKWVGGGNGSGQAETKCPKQDDGECK
jgi:hypothetical protein